MIISFENDNENIINKICFWFNIYHKERIRENSSNFQYVFIINKNLEILQLQNIKYNNKYILLKSNKKIDIDIKNTNIKIKVKYYEDVLHKSINYKFNKQNENKDIFIIPNVIHEKLANELILFLNSTLNVKKEYWSENQNVNCDYLNLENVNGDLKLVPIIKKIIEYNYKHYNLLSKGDSGYCLRKIYGPTRFHSDGLLVDSDNNFSNKKIRNVSVIIALNDDYQDGILHFPNQNFSCKIPKFSAICFPPYWTHPHWVSSPKNGYRYTINTWLYE